MDLSLRKKPPTLLLMYNTYIPVHNTRLTASCKSHTILNPFTFGALRDEKNIVDAVPSKICTHLADEQSQDAVVVEYPASVGCELSRLAYHKNIIENFENYTFIFWVSNFLYYAFIFIYYTEI